MTLKKNFRIFLVLMISSIFFLQNCATIFRGTHEVIPVTTNPLGAKIVVDGKEVGTTPMNLKLRRKKIHNIKIEKEGYDPFTIIINRKTSMLPSLVGNYIISLYLFRAIFPDGAIFPDKDQSFFSGVLPFMVGWWGAIAVDFSTGANYILSSSSLVLSLSKGNEKSQSNLIMIDEEHFQKIKWIRIQFADSEEEEIINFAALGEKEKAVSLLRTAVSQGYYFPNLYCDITLETLWDHPAFIELIKPRD